MPFAYLLHPALAYFILGGGGGGGVFLVAVAVGLLFSLAAVVVQQLA